MSHHSGPRPASIPQEANKPAKVQDVQDGIQTAINKAFQPHPAQYKEATVLFTHFSNDDIGVSALEIDLARVLKDEYGFRTRHIVMDVKLAKHPKRQLLDELSYMEASGWFEERCLVILVFSGHGEVITVGQKPTLSIGGAVNTRGQMPYNLLWDSVLIMFEHVLADVVQIMDCCYAADADATWLETLAATSGTEITTSNHKTCFTQALITSLKDLASAGQSVSIAGIQKHMMNNRRDLQLEHTPFYSPQPSEKSSSRLTPVNNTVTSEVALKTKQPDPRVIITAHVESSLTKNDIEQLKKWLLTCVPTAVASLEITLDGWWKSGSTVLAFNMPLEVWQQLPNDEMFQFSAVVHSKNLLLEQAMTGASPALAIRPRQQDENVRPGGPSKNLK